jgi:hypothetical protein
MSNDTSLIAGSVLAFSVDDGTTYKDLEGIQELPDFREESEEIENTSVKDTTRQYRAGMDSPVEQTLTAYYLKTDADQLAFRTLAKTKSPVKIKVTYADGDSLEVDVTLKNYGINAGDAPSQKMWSCVMRRTGAISFTEATS